MKPDETRRIYQRACREKRLEYSQDEMNRWHRVLRSFEARDVEAALDAWWADTTLTTLGRPKGAFMPEPAELKPLIESSRRNREAKAREPRDWIAWTCLNGHRFLGSIARSEPTPAEHEPCRGCGQELKPERFPA